MSLGFSLPKKISCLMNLILDKRNEKKKIKNAWSFWSHPITMMSTQQHQHRFHKAGKSKKALGLATCKCCSVPKCAELQMDILCISFSWSVAEEDKRSNMPVCPSSACLHTHNACLLLPKPCLALESQYWDATSLGRGLSQSRAPVRAGKHCWSKRAYRQCIGPIMFIWYLNFPCQ